MTMRRLNEILRGARPTSGGATWAAATGGSSAPEPAEGEEARPVCPHCGGAGFLRRSVPLGHPDFGRALPCVCIENEAEEARLERLQRYSNLGPLTRLTFGNLVPRGRSASTRDQALFAQCVEACLSFTEAPEGWLVLSGPSGAGKSHLAAAVANRCLERGVPALFVVVPDLLDHLRAALASGASPGGPPADGEEALPYPRLFEQVRNAPVLILDDLGTQQSTPWVQEKLFQLINHRYTARLPTVVTSNLAPQGLPERLRTRLTDPALARVFLLEQSRFWELQELEGGQQPLLRSMTFQGFDAGGVSLSEDQRRSLEEARRAALTFADEPEGWLVLLGGHGSGKTHLAAAIANYRRERGDPPLFVVVPDLLDHLRAAFNPDRPAGGFEADFERVRTAPLLILDDLGAHAASPWAQEKLFQLLNHRYNGRLPTVITTACALEELDERLASRMIDPKVSNLIPILAPDYRGEIRASARPPGRRPESRGRREPDGPGYGRRPRAR